MRGMKTPTFMGTGRDRKKDRNKDRDGGTR